MITFFKNNNNRLGIILMVASFVISKISRDIIFTHFENRALNEDIFFKLTPYVQPLEYVADIILIVIVIVFILKVAIPRIRKFPYYSFSIASMYTLRAVLNLLTPLGNPLGNTTGHGILKDYYLQPGMFPSGHTGLAFIFFLLIDRVEQPRLKKLFLVLFLIEIVTMVLSRGHYSIDIAGGMMLSYSVYKLIEPHEKQLTNDE